MSRKLDLIKKKFEDERTITVLLELLRIAQEEQDYSEIIVQLELWDGPHTPEIDFYLGTAYIESGRLEEGVKKLRSVIEVNPNHFKARKKLDEIGSALTDEDDKEPSIVAQKEIKLPKVTIDQTDSYRKTRNRTILYLSLFVFVILTFLLFIKEGAKKVFVEELKNPEIYFFSQTFNGFERTEQEILRKEPQNKQSDNTKKALFYLYTYAVSDFNLRQTSGYSSKASFTYTMINNKDTELQKHNDLFENPDNPESPFYLNYLDAHYPATKKKIEQLDLSIPAQITRENIRTVWLRMLLLYRTGEFEKALKIGDRLLEMFPDFELAEKVFIAARARRLLSQDKKMDNDEYHRLKKKLQRWKNMSEERYLLGEASVFLARSAQDIIFEKDGFYLSCPGRYFCGDHIRSFLRRGHITEARTMATFIKEQKGLKRTAEDVKLVMITSHADEDYGNCYFAFKELQQFFPNEVDRDSVSIGSFCSEKEGYLEETIAYYNQLNQKSPTSIPAYNAKILELRYKLRPNEELIKKLQSMVKEYPESLPILYPYFNVLKVSSRLKEIESVLRTIYTLEKPENKLDVIEKLYETGAISVAVELLEKGKENPEFKKRLTNIYVHYFIFEKAQALNPEKKLTENPLWSLIKKSWDSVIKKQHYLIISNIVSYESQLKKCDPALLFLKAEAYRLEGNKQRTFSMIDGMLECNKNYLPGLIFASEISFYQGDITRAEKGLSYIFNREKYLSPTPKLYHNYLVLLQAEIMISRGKERKIFSYLKKNLVKTIPFGTKEQEKLRDVLDKLTSKQRLVLEKYIKRNYPFRK